MKRVSMSKSFSSKWFIFYVSKLATINPIIFLSDARQKPHFSFIFWHFKPTSSNLYYWQLFRIYVLNQNADFLKLLVGTKSSLKPRTSREGQKFFIHAVKKKQTLLHWCLLFSFKDNVIVLETNIASEKADQEVIYPSRKIEAHRHIPCLYLTVCLSSERSNETFWSTKPNLQSSEHRFLMLHHHGV